MTTKKQPTAKRTTARATRETLTGKQRAFVLAYFANGFVGWRAAQAAGYKGDEASLRASASRTLANANVRRAIEKEWKQAAMPADEVIGRLTAIARGSLHGERYDPQAALNTLAKYHGLLVDRVKNEDWRSEAVEALKAGKITPDGAIDAFGDELARELFALAGVKRE